MTGKVMLAAMLAVIALEIGMLWHRAYAQELDPFLGQAAYLSSDPINPDRLALATPSGRYAVTAWQGCDGMADGQNIWIYPSLDLPPWLAAAPTTWDGNGQPPCLFRLEGRMDATPCFMNDAQQCDVAAEQRED